MFISVDDLTNNTILAQTFTVFGTFGLTFAKKIKRTVQYRTIEHKQKRILSTPSFTISCKVTTATGGAVTNGIGAVTHDGVSRWQADFTNVAPGINYKLVYSITAGGTTFNGTTITGLRVPQAGLPITISAMPLASGVPGDLGRTYMPTGQFGTALNPLNVADFWSRILINGNVVHEENLLDLVIFIARVPPAWQLNSPHIFDHPAGTSASHVIQLTMNDGSVRRASRLGL
ncbi:MAG TPA: hypothetical protein VHR66_03770 [Gemmataceae bacterium]|jgi:hypothetical protein|nr:hypothetical protein [Gemmataceae bacterium]